MSGYVETPCRTFNAGAALAEGLRVVLSGSDVVLAGASDVSLGTVEDRCLAANDPVSIRLRNAQGTKRMIANAAITKGNPVYAAASGKVGPTGAIREGVALETTTADGDVLEVLSDDAPGGSVFTATAAAAEGSGNSIPIHARAVNVTAVTTDANDYVVLPAIASMQIGDTIVISCNAGSNFELRTPAASGTKINDVDSDGTQEYLCTDTHQVIVRKHTTTGWVAQSLTKLGAVVTAVVPD